MGSEDHKIYCLDAKTGSKAWEFETGDYVYSSPAVSEGHVYVGSNDKKVYCLDARTGIKVWEFETGDAVISSPAVSGGYVYVGSMDYNVYCLSTQTGKQVWSFKTDAYVTNSPAVTGDYVYVKSASLQGDSFRPYTREHIFCLNARTGKKLWRYETGLGYSEYGSLAVADGNVYVGGADGYIYCLSAAPGDTGSWFMFKGNPARTGAATINP